MSTTGNPFVDTALRALSSAKMDPSARAQAYRQVFATDAGRVVMGDILYQAGVFKAQTLNKSTSVVDEAGAPTGRALALYIMQQCFPESATSQLTPKPPRRSLG